MLESKVGEIVGTGARPVRWERPLIFFLALTAADMVWFILGPSLFSSGRMERPKLTFFNIPPPTSWLEALAFNALMVIAATLVFALVRNIFAILPIAIGYGLLATGLIYLFTLMSPVMNPQPFWNMARVMNLVSNTLWALLFLSLLELSLRLIKNLPLALLAGAVTTSLLLFPINYLLNLLAFKSSMAFLDRLIYLPFNLLSSALLALALWAGLRISSGPHALTEQPAEPRVSKRFHLGIQFSTNGVGLILCMASIVLMAVGVWRIREVGDATPIFMLLGISTLLVIISIVAFCVLVYKMWAAIQDGHARTRPGWAVGALFIPIYNIYWMFQVFPGFATDYNAYLTRHGINAPPLSTSIFTAYVAMCIIVLIPYLGLLAVPAAYIVMLLMIAQICDAVNRVPAVQPVQAPAQWAATEQLSA